MNYWTQSPDNVYVAAHRGWSEKYPENTMEAFRAALTLGVDQIEFDVHMTKDGHLVIMHDHTVDRTTDGTGLVREMTLEQVKNLDAGIKKDVQFAGTEVPTMEELMELVKDHPTITLDLELKDYPTEGMESFAYESCDKALAMIDAYGFTDRIVVNSWSAKLNEYIVTKYGKKYRQHLYYPASLMGEYVLEPYSYGYCVCAFSGQGYKGNRGIGSRDECDMLRSKGLRPWAGTAVKDEETAQKALDSCCELITCNNPDQVLAILRAKGKHK